MTTNHDAKEIQNFERRQFLKAVGVGGFTTAALVAAAGTLGSDEAIAQTAKEERERQKAAKHVMTIATAYILGASRSYPIMQLDLKENIQNADPWGDLRETRAPVVSSVQAVRSRRRCKPEPFRAAQHSLSNFAPFAPVVDLINLPYFCGANQRFVNLVNSDAWKAEVHAKVNSKGFQAALLCGD